MKKRFLRKLSDSRGVSMIQGVVVMNFMCIAMLATITQLKNDVAHIFRQDITAQTPAAPKAT